MTFEHPLVYAVALVSALWRPAFVSIAVFAAEPQAPRPVQSEANTSQLNYAELPLRNDPPPGIGQFVERAVNGDVKARASLGPYIDLASIANRTTDALVAERIHWLTKGLVQGGEQEASFDLIANMARSRATRPFLGKSIVNSQKPADFREAALRAFGTYMGTGKRLQVPQHIRRLRPTKKECRALRKCLLDKDARVREQTALAIGYGEIHELRHTLRQLAQGERDESVRKTMLATLKFNF